MSTTYPTSLDNLTSPSASSQENVISHAGQHANANDSINALETKVGVDSSAVTTTLDYKLKNSASIDPGHHHTNTTLDSLASSKITGVTFPASGLIVGTTDSQTLTNKILTTPTLTSPVLNTGVSGTAIDTDGTLAANSDTILASQKAVKTYVTTNAGSPDGWTSDSHTWVYASASTFTIAGVDVTATFAKGTRLRFTQTTVKYAVVVSSSFSTNTTVTIAVNTDYTLANAAISVNSYSYQLSPQGYPTFFNRTPTFSTDGSAFTNAPTSNQAKFAIEGNKCIERINFRYNLTSGGTGNTKITTAVTPAYTANSGWGLRASDSKVLGVQLDTSFFYVSLYDGTTSIVNNNLCDVGAIYTF